MSDQERPDRERELAELLAEVRALRREIEALKADPSAATSARNPSYEVLVKTRPNVRPDYEVLVKAGKLPPNYEVAVAPIADLPPNYEVAVKALVPGEAVLARPAYRPGYEVAVNTLPKLPPDYEVAVKTVFPGADEQVKLPPDYAVAVKAFTPKDAVMLRVAYPPGRTAGKGDLPPDYEVAVRGPFIPAEDPARGKS
ncbi:MAG TPA: hypothetical protein VKE51_07945 [Vicinamibacterales bacterium]|nr:hypothetical protein [Vicinamibacterales bacterium]